MIRAAIALVLVVLLSGCAGQATYQIHPFFDSASQSVICCEATIQNSKDISGVAVHVVKTKNGYTFDFQETGVGASAPISAQSGAITSVSNAVSNTAAAVVKSIK